MLAFSLLLTIVGWVIYIEKGDTRIPWALAFLGFGSIPLGSRWLFLENMMARAMGLFRDPHRDPRHTAQIRNVMDKALTSSEWRATMCTTLSAAHAFKLYDDHGRGVLALNIQFPPEWEQHAYLQAATGWIGVCMPMPVHCLRVDRKGTRLAYQFMLRHPTGDTHEDMRQLQQALAEWSMVMGKLLQMPMGQVSAQISAELIPTQVPTMTPSPTGVPMAPSRVFERSISLEHEAVVLYVGFNGHSYYTKFGEAGPARTYASWEALWSVWKHLGEVQKAFG